jgi:hypothetical protein
MLTAGVVRPDDFINTRLRIAKSQWIHGQTE